MRYKIELLLAFYLPHNEILILFRPDGPASAGQAGLYFVAALFFIYHHTKLGAGRSPQLWEPLAQWVPKRVKVDNISSVPAAHAEYSATNVMYYIPPVGAVAAVKTPLDCNWQNANDITHKV